ncbi:MAG: glutathione peroxidase [Bacteroidales bacterium]|nr:glutathione peroxidase [Bacteroidales bacterium]MBQ5881304.1 glutathione peroxidase [Bacteroidales bacterium]
MKRILNFIVSIVALSVIGSCNLFQGKTNLYDFEVMAQKNQPLPLSQYKGKVVLIVNTASKCGFTFQYQDLQRLYDKYNSKGFEILDFPCDQFGGQSPESDEQTTEFCQLNYGTTFAQLQQIEVNGENESPLYTWLKSEKGFFGFDRNNPVSQKLDDRLKKVDPDYAKSSDIKWNFTKFLIDREGNVVARFEPTADITRIDDMIQAQL